MENDNNGNITKVGDQLLPEQIDELISGGSIEFVQGAGSEKSQPSSSDTEDTESGAPERSANNYGDDDDSDEENIGFGFGASALKEKSRAGRKGGLPFAVLLIAVIIAFAGGAALVYSHYFGFKPSAEYIAADDAAYLICEYLTPMPELADNSGQTYDSEKKREKAEQKAKKERDKQFKKDVQAKTDEVVFFDIYVKNSTLGYECIIFCALNENQGEYIPTHFRVISGDVQEAFDAALYAALKEGTDEERIEASVMANHRDAFEKSIAEIKAGSGDWIKINGYTINAGVGKILRIDKILER